MAVVYSPRDTSSHDECKRLQTRTLSASLAALGVQARLGESTQTKVYYRHNECEQFKIMLMLSMPDEHAIKEHGYLYFYRACILCVYCDSLVLSKLNYMNVPCLWAAPVSACAANNSTSAEYLCEVLF